MSIGKNLTVWWMNPQIWRTARLKTWRGLEGVAAALISHETHGDFKGKEQAEEVVHDLRRRWFLSNKNMGCDSGGLK